MRRERALLDAIVAAPEDDAPRLVWADEVGGERGELVVLQCDLARGGLSLEDACARRRREAELLAAHGGDWAGLGLRTYAWRFRRGFVDAVASYSGHLIADAEGFFAAAPALRSVTVLGLQGDVQYHRDPMASMGDLTEYRVAQVLALPQLARIDRLTLLDTQLVKLYDDDDDEVADREVIEGRGDVCLALLAGWPHLANLRGLAITGGAVTPRGLHHLVAAQRTARLETLWLDGELGLDGVQALLRVCPALRSLSLHASDAQVFAHLPPLHGLRLCDASDPVLAALAASPLGASLRELSLAGGRFEDARVLERLPQLEALSVHDASFARGPSTGAHLPPHALARVVLPRLRTLELVEAVDVDEDAIAIAVAFGRQLERFSYEPDYELEVPDYELPRLVAGAVVAPDRTLLL